MSNVRSNPNAFLAPRPPQSKSNRVLEQIESAADYYSPLIYTNLSYYSNLKFDIDSLSNEFIPVTQVKANPKLFVVGLVPPAANVTGRLLDRSASVASVVGAAEDLPDIPQVSSQGGQADLPVNSDGTVGNAIRTVSGRNLPPSFWDSYVRMCQRLKVNPNALAAPLELESGFNPHAGNSLGVKGAPAIAKGLNQLIRSTATSMGMTAEQWDNYGNLSGEEQLPWVEKYFRGKVAGKNAGQIYGLNAGGYNNPDGSLYASKARQAEFIAANPGAVFPNADYQDKAVAQNPGLAGGKGYIAQSDLNKAVVGRPSTGIREQIEAAAARVGIAPPTRPATPTQETTNGGWQKQGSKNAAASKQEKAKTFDNGLAQEQAAELGKRFKAAQAAEINATIQALEAMRNTPPLRFLVNPSSFKVSSEKVISDGNWTRNGPIIEHWGDGQDKLEGSGRVAAFFAIDANQSGGGPGLTRGARNFSASYQNFLSLWMLYRSNAGLYLEGLDGTSWNRLSMVGSIYIYYDNTLYLGSFDNFNVTETESAPYTLEYNFQFTVRATFLLDRPDDPSHNYGAPTLFSGNRSAPTQEQEFLSRNQNVALPQGTTEKIQSEYDAQNDSRQAAEDFVRASPPSGESNIIDPSVRAATQTRKK